MPVQVTRGALVAQRYIYASSRSRTSQYLRAFVPLPVSLLNDLADPVLNGVGLRVSRAGAGCTKVLANSSRRVLGLAVSVPI